MVLPDLNKRIKIIIEDKANGSVRRFALEVGISQQKINRLFNIDTRTNKYPTVTSDILIKISEMFVDIDLRWLLTGQGSMIIKDLDRNLMNEKPALEMIKDLAAENALLKKENSELKKELKKGYGNIAAEP